jgi:hypothetical protein
MARPRNPFSNRNRNEKFTGAYIAQYIEKHGHGPVGLANPTDDETVMLAKSKRAKVVRDAGEFDMRTLQALMKAPLVSSAAYSWSLENIIAARNAQMIGDFSLAARLSESFNTDDALFTARSVRLAPVQSLGVKVVACSEKGERIAAEGDALFGEQGIAFSRATENTLRAHLVDHGVAFGAITWTPREDGSRWDPVLNAWPIEFVRWDALANTYVTRIDPSSQPTLNMERQADGSFAYVPGSLSASGLEPIRHGNGRWVVFQKSELLPHRSADATLLPAALVWPCHAFANRDWRKGSASHGNVKVVGELDENTPLTDGRQPDGAGARVHGACSPTSPRRTCPTASGRAARRSTCSRTPAPCGKCSPSSPSRPSARRPASTWVRMACSAPKVELPASTSRPSSASPRRRPRATSCASATASTRG